MDFIDKLVLDHVLKSPSAIAAIAYALLWIDRGIVLGLKYFSAKQIDSAIDAVAAAAKARVDADSAKAAAPLPPTP